MLTTQNDGEQFSFFQGCDSCVRHDCVKPRNFKSLWTLEHFFTLLSLTHPFQVRGDSLGGHVRSEVPRYHRLRFSGASRKVKTAVRGRQGEGRK